MHQEKQTNDFIKQPKYMNDLIQFAQNKLDDPVIMAWALRQYENAYDQEPVLAKRMLQLWFDDLTLSKWIKSDDYDSLSRIFKVIPADRFCTLRSAIIERWPDWQDTVAYHAIPAFILDHEDDGDIHELFRLHISNRFEDTNKTCGVINHLQQLPKPTSIGLLDQITDKTLKLESQSLNKSFFLGELLTSRIQLNPEATESIFSAVLKNMDAENGIKQILMSLTRTLHGSDALFDLATWIKTGEAEQTFSSLRAFFLSDAPLEKCDDIISRDDMLSDALQLLDQYDEQNIHVQQASQFVKQAQRVINKKEALDDLACFALVSALATFSRNTLDNKQFTLDEAINLLSADLSTHPYKEDLTEYIRQFDDSEILKAIEQQLPHVKDYYGSIHLAELGGELELTGFTSTLIDLIKDDCSDFLCEAAKKALIKLGKPTQTRLVEQWSTLDNSQMIYGSSVIRKIGGQEAVDFAIDQFSTLFFDDLECWCGLALVMPDMRSIELLEPEVKRKQSIIDETYYQLCVLLDHPAENLNDIRDRMLKSCKERYAQLTALNNSESFERDSLNLLLRCQQCDVENNYKIKSVLLSEKKGYPNILVDEVQCASCEAWADFDFTSQAHLALTTELLIAQTEHSAFQGYQGPIRLDKCIYKSQERVAAELIYELESSVAEKGDIVDCLELGRINQLFGRTRKAQECYRRVYDDEPNLMEAGLGLSLIDVVQGDVNKGFKRLNKLLQQKNNWRFYRANRLPSAQLGKEFATLYNNLHKRLEINTYPMLHAAFMGKSQKVGRNDPCLCGSGKKYKKCCLISG